MPDPRQTVDRIRALLDPQGAGVNADIATVATDYAELCGLVNPRLRRCAEFLRDGLIGEAVDQAGGKPSLIELTSALDFSEFPAWEQKCQAMGLPRPTRPAVENIPVLQQALEKYEALRDVLAKCRYLALARASLTDRLMFLRQLITIDPQNAGWKRDAEEMERMRLADLRNEAAAAARSGDAATLARLLAELNTGPWLTPIPDELKISLTQASTALHQATAVDQLQGLVPAVRQALASGSLEQAQQVFGQWARVVKTARILVPPDLRQEILPLGQWLDDQEDLRERDREFRMACEKLAAAIRSHTPLDFLTRRYREACAFSMEIPDDLLSLYHREVQSARKLLRVEKQKQFALAAMLIGAILLALAALGYVMMGNGKL